MHDAAEAYLSDLPSPVKDLNPKYKEIEDRLLLSIFNVYGMDEDDLRDIQAYDRAALQIEFRDLWGEGKQVEESKKLKPAASSVEAELKFLRRYIELMESEASDEKIY